MTLFKQYIPTFLATCIVMLFLTISACLLALYLYWTRILKFWEKKGVKQDQLISSLCNLAKFFLRTKNMATILKELHFKYPTEKVIGWYVTNPILLVRDPEIIKRMIATDFQYFFGRIAEDEGKDLKDFEILRSSVLFVKGDMWKLLRQNVTPAFSYSKLKSMFPLLVGRGKRIQDLISRLSSGGKTINAREIMLHYTVDVISAYGLGINLNEDNDPVFKQLTLDIGSVHIRDIIVYHLKTMFPITFKKLKYFGRIETQFCNLIKDVVMKRNSKPSGLDDLIDFLLKIREKGEMKCESMTSKDADGTPQRVTALLDDKLLTAQAFLFFIAGYETSTFTTSYTLHELAYNPEKQKKVQADIDRALAKHENEFSLDAIKDMRYLEYAFMEAMRLQPPVGFLMRTCRRDYTIEELGVKVEKDTVVTFSTLALHNDPQFWDRPLEFRPERFGPEFDEPKHKFAYLPFGAGPRSCIGQRLGLTLSLAGLAAILSCFTVSPAPTSVRHPKLNPKSYAIEAFYTGLPLIFTPRT